MIETTMSIHREPMALEATLRDYFAAKAMPWVASDVPAGSNFQDKVAVLSYAMADAMLKARKEQT